MPSMNRMSTPPPLVPMPDMRPSRSMHPERQSFISNRPSIVSRKSAVSNRVSISKMPNTWEGRRQSQISTISRKSAIPTKIAEFSKSNNKTNWALNILLFVFLFLGSSYLILSEEDINQIGDKV